MIVVISSRISQTAKDAIAKAILRASYADPQWLNAMFNCAIDLAQEQNPFTTDDVWKRFNVLYDGLNTADTSALGVVMKTLSYLDFIQKTGRAVRSERPLSHGKLLPIWMGIPAQTYAVAA